VKIEVEKICKTFPARDGAPTIAVDNVDLSVGASEFVSLLGPSGCGKKHPALADRRADPTHER
jgi:ABC-type sugar transport system ATPase subunit